MRKNSHNKAHKNENIFLSVVIPAYNEEKRIASSLKSIVSYLNNQEFQSEIIMVDDGSTDNTIQLVEGLDVNGINLNIIWNERNSGKCYSIRRGVQESAGEIILFSDADLSTPIEEFEKFLPYLNDGYDVVIGSRGLPESDIEVHQVWYREWMGKKFGSLVRFMALPGISDSQCGFKCFTKSSSERIFPRQKLNGFCFDVELLYITKKMNYQIKEVPICWRNSPASKVNPIRDSIRMFFDLLKIRFYDMKGKYKDE